MIFILMLIFTLRMTYSHRNQIYQERGNYYLAYFEVLVSNFSLLLLLLQILAAQLSFCIIKFGGEGFDLLALVDLF